MLCGVSDTPWLMRRANADVVIELRKITNGSPHFRGFLSLEILLNIARAGRSIELRRLFREVGATQVAIRQHMQDLARAGYLTVETDAANRRCKVARLTPSGWQMLTAWETSIETTIAKWASASSDLNADAAPLPNVMSLR